LYDALGRITEVGQKPQSTAMTSSISRSQNSLSSWISAGGFVKQQITKTVYDLPVINTGVNDRLVQRNLRNRVSYTQYWDLESNPEWNSAVFYSYDIHGNVDTLLNDYGSSLHTATQNPMNLTGNRWKKIVYRYDLISGKVNHVAYQPNARDALYHRYVYDAENRLIQAEISKDSLYWERDAKYTYYRHGPLARTVIGEQKVQGLDYAYTLQGWLKAVNGTVMNPLYDMGKDGHNSNNVARDTFGFMLYYHDNDYTAIGEASRFKGLRARLIGTSSHRPLFNGNISAMAVNIGVLNKPVLYDYTYDQLNRLTAMDMFNGTNAAANLWDVPAGTFLPVVHYRERIAYDANGNITKYRRNASNGQHLMDSLSYYYKPGTNQLTYVRDSIPGYFYSDYYAEATGRRGHDIDNQFVNNYAYDSIGNLVRDSAEAIRLTVGGIKWNVYGKITEINKIDSGFYAFNAGRFKKINYYYDASGNRIGARYERYGGKPTYSTWYVRDASGNVMGVYSYTDSMRLSELHLYGSSRLGVLQPGINMQATVPTGVSMPQLDQTINQATFTRGNKFFELSNHLGNVLVTLSDKKRGVQNGSTGTVLHYLSIVKSAQDYYPFGMVMPLRQFTSGSSYRYGFNGKEEDDEVKGNGNQLDYGFRIYDPRLGRFLSVDPLAASYPWNSSYAFAENDVMRSVDIDGLEKKVVIHWIDKINDDGTLHISKTSISIDQNARFDGWGRPSAASKSSGSVFAVTETYYYFMSENKISKGKVLLENANVTDVNPPPSAQYDYTKNVMDKKAADDRKWAGLNPFKWLRITSRDIDAPDNAMTVEDVGMGMLAFTSIVGAPAMVKGMLKAEGVAVDGINGTVTKQRNGSFEGPGGMARLKYEKAPYHGTENGIMKSKAPADGQGALDGSLQVKETSPRRIGIDYTKNEFVVFDKTLDNIYHGHVRSWAELHQDMKNILIKNGMADSKGKVLTGTQ
jgi:RHS repeat-associated protein